MQIVSVKDEVSRHNTPSNAIAIWKEIKGLKIADKVQQLSIVLYAEYDDILASVAACARSFSTYTQKTKKSDLESIQVEVVVTDGKVGLFGIIFISVFRR